ncbi:hypothetical protein [Nonomuraea sp. NPDC049480]|uniref:hypothetical protein n=1 Tax=Nonomuraea sp. NPDC049480 TaxID=3364353 RepID=UPI00378EB6EB
MSRHKREPGLLPRPLAILGALALTGATGVVIRFLPAGAASPSQPQPPPATRHSPPLSQAVAAKSAVTFVSFVDTAREPGLDLPAESRRTGVRHYALAHLVAGGDDGCAPKWAGPFEPDADETGEDEPGEDAAGSPEQDGTDPAETDADGSGALGSGAARKDPLDPGENPVANTIGGLRALGGDAAPVFGGPDGTELAVTCTRPGGLAAAYRRVVGAFDAAAIGFEVRDSEDGAAVLRRARAIRAMQRERPLRVSFTLPLTPYGLGAGDVAMLRTTHQAGAEVGTVNLLATMEPHSAPSGRLRRLSAAIRLARDQIAQAQDLSETDHAWRRIALTPVLASEDDLSEVDAHMLTDYAARHGLAWLSLRGVAPSRQVSRILWGA